MRICRLRVQNFRNFQELDFEVGQNLVLVGENKIGKSNLLFGLQLVLDPTLPDALRQLNEEDFWDGLPRPLGEDALLRISVDLTDFETVPEQLAVLAEHLIQAEPMVARLTYEFRAKVGLDGPPETSADFEFSCYGGDRQDNSFGYETRSRIPIMVLPALRDAVRDLGAWRSSPLRPLLEEAASTIDRATLQQIADDIEVANSALTGTKQLEAVQNQINDQLEDMVGERHAVDTSLGFAQTDPERLIRAVRLFIDKGKRGVGDASLGSANLLYLTLRALELRQEVEQGTRDHTFLAVEEPEAHLHPQLQRLVYREFLARRGQQEAGPNEEPDQAPGEQEMADDDEASSGEESSDDVFAHTTVIFTTHSPHIVSVAPLESLALLKARKGTGPASTFGVSTAGLGLAASDVGDLERYLDVTRGEILFAAGVILVEGEAELYLVPALASALGHDLDRAGVSVCSVAGTHFGAYVKLLGSRGLRIPFSVVTDNDPPASKKTGLTPGQKRCLALLSLVAPKTRSLDEKQRMASFEGHGLFLNDTTLEVDLVEASEDNARVVCEVLIELLRPAQKLQAQIVGWIDDPSSLDADKLLSLVERVGKGRFAQRLASRADELTCPDYIRKAVERVAS